MSLLDSLNLDGLKESVTSILDNLNKKKEQGGDSSSKEGSSDAQDKKETDGIRGANTELSEAVDLASKMNANLELKDVVAPTAMGEAAIRQMESVDMAKIIGAPINAAVTAQFDAARKMLAGIQEIGIKNNTLAVVTFNFFKNGKKAVMTVPLLTLVPITAMGIKELTYAFKLKIDTESSVNLQTNVENSVGYGLPASNPSSKETKETKENKVTKADSKGEGSSDKEKTEITTKALDAVKGAVRTESTFATSFSSKKDSKATQNSKYNVETTIDINMTVAPDTNQPAGISKMLEILNNTIDVHNPNGELIVEQHRVNLVNGVAVVSVIYINGEGLYSPGKVTCKKADAKDDKIRVLAMNNGDKVDLIFVEPGVYTVAAEKLDSYIIVDAEQVKEKPKAESKPENKPESKPEDNTENKPKQ